MYVIKWLWCSNSCSTATEPFYGSVTDTLFLHLSHEHKPTRDPGSPAHGPAMNSVTVSATFDVGRFLANNVGVVPTRADMSPTFPTKLTTIPIFNSWHYFHQIRGQLYGTQRLRMMEQLLLVISYDKVMQYTYMNMTSLE